MPPRDTSLVGVPCWIDLMTSDQEGARAFYSRLFGWTGAEGNAEFGGYFNFSKNDGLVAGCMGKEADSPMPDMWSVYLDVKDAQAAVDAVGPAGGTIMIPPMVVGDLGTMVVALDAGNAGIGMWQAGEHKGMANVAEEGTPGWFELMTRDYDASVKFYQDVFGWKTSVMSDAEDFRYTTLGDGPASAAGIMDAAGFLPEGVPAHWSVYFRVADADASISLITEMGGSVLTAAQDTPFGRMATVADPTGAMFKIMQSNQ